MLFLTPRKGRDSYGGQDLFYFKIWNIEGMLAALRFPNAYTPISSDPRRKLDKWFSHIGLPLRLSLLAPQPLVILSI